MSEAVPPRRKRRFWGESKLPAGNLSAPGVVSCRIVIMHEKLSGMESIESAAERTCRATHPETGISCTLPDTTDAHLGVHAREYPRVTWPTTPGDLIRWEVLTISDLHVESDESRGHRRTTRGCMWCILDARAEAADELLRVLNPDEWVGLLSHTVRYLLASDDLRQTADLFISPVITGGLGVVNYLGSPPPGASAAAITEAHLIAQRARRREHG